MYAGPTGPLVAAAKMWDSVASDLFSAASAFQSVSGSDDEIVDRFVGGSGWWRRPRRMWRG